MQRCSNANLTIFAFSAQLTEFYTSLLDRNSNNNSVDQQLAQIRSQLDAEMEILRNFESKFGQGAGDSFEQHFEVSKHRKNVRKEQNRIKNLNFSPMKMLSNDKFAEKIPTKY